MGCRGVKDSAVVGAGIRGPWHGGGLSRTEQDVLCRVQQTSWRTGGLGEVGCVLTKYTLTRGNGEACGSRTTREAFAHVAPQVMRPGVSTPVLGIHLPYTMCDDGGYQCMMRDGPGWLG